MKNETITNDTTCEREKWSTFPFLPSVLPTSPFLWMESEIDVYIVHLFFLRIIFNIDIELYDHFNNNVTSTLYFIGFIFTIISLLSHHFYFYLFFLYLYSFSIGGDISINNFSGKIHGWKTRSLHV